MGSRATQPASGAADNGCMKRITCPEQFAADPIGHYWLGDNQLVWCADATTCGSLHWGQPSERDARELTRALELARHPMLARTFTVFMDAHDIERVEWPAFMHLFGYVRDRLPEWGTRIRRQAVIVPPGPVGALLAGMVPLVGMTYPMRFFARAPEALDWLEWRDVPAVAEATEIAASARGLAPTVRRLRAWLDGALLGPALDVAAASLGLSSRTLQRELKAGGTSFTEEIHAARVRAASSLLESTDEKVEVIARSVGCASASQLSVLFRRRVGATPASYRARLQRK